VLLRWLVTRPVIEHKRLPELVESQVCYLAEMVTWLNLLSMPTTMPG
jgi:hypothetical protein